MAETVRNSMSLINDGRADPFAEGGEGSSAAAFTLQPSVCFSEVRVCVCVVRVCVCERVCVCVCMS